jgi:histidine ammonia-lyase
MIPPTRDHTMSPESEAGGREPLLLTGDSLTAASVVRVARGGARVEVAEESWQRIAAARRVVDMAVAAGIPLYGVTSGLGDRAGEALPAEALADFSLMTLRGRATAVGPPLPADVVRASMVIRLNTLCLGHGGASRDVVESLRDVLNAGLVPWMPETGSIGSSDLCVMAHLGLALVGEGAFLGSGDAGNAPRPRAALEILNEHGIARLAPGPKDGLVLCSNSACTAARTALALADAARALETAQTTAAMSLEGYRGNPGPLDARVAGVRPQPGQERAAAGLRLRLQGSALYRPGGPRRLQDPLSLRCVAPVHGAALAALDFLWSALEPEINGAGDNPVVLAEENAVVSTGNFQMPLLTVALDAAGQALAHVAVGAVGRCARLLSGEQAGLPLNLTRQRPHGAGFAPLMKTAEALLAEIRQDAASRSAEGDVGEVREAAGARTGWSRRALAPGLLRPATISQSSPCRVCSVSLPASTCGAQRAQPAGPHLAPVVHHHLVHDVGERQLHRAHGAVGDHQRAGPTHSVGSAVGASRREASTMMSAPSRQPASPRPHDHRLAEVAPRRSAKASRLSGRREWTRISSKSNRWSSSARSSRRCRARRYAPAPDFPWRRQILAPRAVSAPVRISVMAVASSTAPRHAGAGSNRFNSAISEGRPFL